MTENGVKSTILYLFSAEGYSELNFYLSQCKEIEIYENFNEEKNITQTAPTILVTTEVFNLMCCIELLTICCEGKSDLAEQRCQ